MKVTTRFATQEDVPTFVEWITHTPKNLLDPDIAKYPSLRTLAVDINGKPSVYAPFHPVLMIESLAHRPDLTPRENAYALFKVQADLETIAVRYGIAEVYWLCADESLISLAERRGYEVVQVKVLRKKVAQDANPPR